MYENAAGVICVDKIYTHMQIYARTMATGTVIRLFYSEFQRVSLSAMALYMMRRCAMCI